MVAGSYVFGTFTIDAQGRVTSATDGPLTDNGDMIFQFGGLPNRLQVGSEGQALVVSGGYPSWQDLGTGGTVTSIDIVGGTGITSTGGPVTNAGSITIGLADSGATAGFYSNASIVVDAAGRVVSAQAGDQGVPVIIASSAPTGRDDGSALQSGDQWLDTGDNSLYVREGSTWTAIAGGGGGGGGLTNVVQDTTPELGGNLDVHNFYIQSTDGSVNVDPTNGELIVRGGSSEGKLTLNCTANTHGVSIQSPPHSAAATYTLTLPETTGTTGQVLSTDGSGALSWADNAGGGGGGGVTQIVAGAGISVDQGTGIVTISATGGGGGGSAAGVYLQETQTASGGAADYVALGYSGIVQKVTSNLDTWVVLYSSAAARTADASRTYNTDPTPGSGVLFEAYISSGGEVVATPGTTYMNSEASLTEAVYAAVRDQSGVAVDATVTVSAYSLADSSGGSGGGQQTFWGGGNFTTGESDGVAPDGGEFTV